MQVDEGNVHKSLDEAFAGVEVIVNTLPSSVADDNLNVLHAVARSNAKVYFLREFENDHRVTDFPGFEPTAKWRRRQELAREARRSCKGKVIALYTSLSLRARVGPPRPRLRHREYRVYGVRLPRAADHVHLARDVGRAVARLAMLATDPTTAVSVPGDVRVAGSTVTFEEVRDIVARVRAVAASQIKRENLAAKREALKLPDVSFPEVGMGEGKMDSDFGEANDSELVNPGGRLWMWKLAEDYVRGQFGTQRSE